MTSTYPTNVHLFADIINFSLCNVYAELELIYEVTCTEFLTIYTDLLPCLGPMRIICAVVCEVFIVMCLDNDRPIVPPL